MLTGYQTLFRGHPAYLGSVPFDLAMSPPGEQKCGHLYFIGEIVCSSPWPSVSKPSSACSLGSVSHHVNPVCTPRHLCMEKRLGFLFPHSGQFPSGAQSPGIDAHLLWTQHLP